MESKQALDLSGSNATENDLKIKLAGRTDWLEINISDNPSLTSIAPLANQKMLRLLDIRDTEINDLHILPASVFENLEELYLSDSHVKNLAFLPHCKKLQSLFLTNLPITGKDLFGLSYLTTLKELSITNTKVKNDLSFLSKLTTLRKLYANKIDVVSASILQLKPLSQLQVLEVDTELQSTRDSLFQLFNQNRKKANNQNISAEK